MNTVIFLALVAFASAVPNQYSLEALETPYDRDISGDYTWLNDYFGQGNTFHVPQYIAYQFHYFQQMKYSPDQVSQYFTQYGYPMYVVQYLTNQYEAGLDKSYSQTPYMMYQYYYKQMIPQEVQDYIQGHIYNYFQQFQKYMVTYGLPQVFEQEYSVPMPFSQYMSQQLRFYTQKGFNFEQAQVAYQYLESALRYTQSIMQYFATEAMPKTMTAYMSEHLQYAFDNLREAYQVYKPYMAGKYVPYYVFQYYVEHIQKAFFYFQNVYQYTQKEHIAFPDSFLYQIQNAFFAIQKVYRMYESVNWFDLYYKPSGIESSYFGGKQLNYDYGYDYPTASQEPQFNWFGKYINKDRYYDNQKYDYGYNYPTISQEPQYYWFGKYMNKDSFFDNQKYGYQYGTFDKYYNDYKFGPYSSSYYPSETSQYRWGFEPTYQKSYQYYGKSYAY